MAKFTPHLESNLCGQSQYPDTTEFTLLGSIPHKTETLTLEFISKVISQGAVGIKNINILLSNNSEISTPSSCFRLYDNKLTNIEGECKSIKGKYINENPCDPSCSNCFGPSSSECFSCSPGFFFNGIQCAKTKEEISTERMLSSVTTEDLDSMDKVIDAINVFGEMSSVGILLSSMTITGNPSAISIINMVKMIQSIRYIDIEYPTKLQYLLYKQDQSSISLNFGVEFSEESKEEDFAEYPIPEIFQTYGLTSNFIVNYWSGLFTIMMACITIITAMFCVWLFSNTQLFCIISRKILEIMRWNFFLIILFSNIDGIGVPASLDLRTIHFDSSLSIFGTALAIIFNLGIPAIIVAIPFIIMALRRSRAKVWNITGVPIRGGIIQVSDSEYKTLQQRLRTCKIFYKNLRDTSLFHQLALFFMLARAYLFHIIVGYLFANPLVQAFFINIMSGFMIVYLVFKRPFTSRLENVKMILYEAMVFLVNLCVLVLALLDYNDYEASSARKRIGDIVIVITLLFNTLVFIFLLTDLALKIRTTYKVAKTTEAKGLAFWKTLYYSFFYNDKPPSDPSKIERKNETKNDTKDETQERPVLRAKQTIKRQFTVKQDQGSDLETNNNNNNNTKGPFTNSTNTPNSLIHLWPPKIVNFSDFSSPQNNSLGSVQSINEGVGGSKGLIPLSLTTANRRYSSQLHLLSPTNIESLDDSNKKGVHSPKSGWRKGSGDLSASASKSSSPSSSQHLPEPMALDKRRRRSTRGRLFSYDNSPHYQEHLRKDLLRKQVNKAENFRDAVRQSGYGDAPVSIQLDYSKVNPQVRRNTLYNIFVSRK